MRRARSLSQNLLRILGASLTLTLAMVPAANSADPLSRVKLHLDPGTVLHRISPEFLGLGYETSAVAQTNYFSPANHRLVQLYRNLGAHGLIRIGGNISDHTRYVANGPTEVHAEREVTVINQASLADLGGFAQATGWRVMWGLNLGTGTPAEAAEEAAAVAQALGRQLQSFEIGNEVDLHGGYRVACTNYSSYYSNYLAYRAAIRARLPAAVFSGPDVAGNLDWLTSFARQEGRGVQLLTHHYYRMGARDPQATLDVLLRPDTGWSDRLDQLQAIAQETGVPYRINEVNSFYGGGKPGVSDAFGSALWCLNYLFVLAAHDCSGANLETDINQLGFISHYSPVVHEAPMMCRARPEYYGLLAFALAGQGELLRCQVDATNLNVSAYATRRAGGEIWVTVINGDFHQDAQVEVPLPAGSGWAEVFRLTAPMLTSTNLVRLAGAEVDAEGRWAPGSPQPIAVRTGAAEVEVSHGSAVLLCLRP